MQKREIRMNTVCFPVSNSSNIISYTRSLAAQNNGEINILERTNPPLMMISQLFHSWSTVAYLVNEDKLLCPKPSITEEETSRSMRFSLTLLLQLS